MRVLHAYICEEYYGNWARQRQADGLSASKEDFLRIFGTPSITYSQPTSDEFLAVKEAGYIRVNPNYHTDCREYRTVLPDQQPSEKLAEVIETTLKSPTIASIRSRFFGWMNFRWLGIR